MAARAALLKLLEAGPECFRKDSGESKRCEERRREKADSEKGSALGANPMGLRLSYAALEIEETEKQVHEMFGNMVTESHDATTLQEYSRRKDMVLLLNQHSKRQSVHERVEDKFVQHFEQGNEWLGCSAKTISTQEQTQLNGSHYPIPSDNSQELTRRHCEQLHSNGQDRDRDFIFLLPTNLSLPSTCNMNFHACKSHQRQQQPMTTLRTSTANTPSRPTAAGIAQHEDEEYEDVKVLSSPSLCHSHASTSTGHVCSELHRNGHNRDRDFIFLLPTNLSLSATSNINSATSNINSNASKSHLRPQQPMTTLTANTPSLETANASNHAHPRKQSTPHYDPPPPRPPRCPERSRLGCQCSSETSGPGHKPRPRSFKFKSRDEASPESPQPQRASPEPEARDAVEAARRLVARFKCTCQEQSPRDLQRDLQASAKPAIVTCDASTNTARTPLSAVWDQLELEAVGPGPDVLGGLGELQVGSKLPVRSLPVRTLASGSEGLRVTRRRSVSLTPSRRKECVNV